MRRRFFSWLARQLQPYLADLEVRSIRASDIAAGSITTGGIFLGNTTQSIDWNDTDRASRPARRFIGQK